MVWLTRVLARIGYPPSETREMEVWETAALLGADDAEPVILGGRSLTLKSDGDDKPDGLVGKDGKPLPGVKSGDMRSNIEKRIAAAKARNPGGHTS